MSESSSNWYRCWAGMTHGAWGLVGEESRARSPAISAKLLIVILFDLLCLGRLKGAIVSLSSESTALINVMIISTALVVEGDS